MHATRAEKREDDVRGCRDTLTDKHLRTPVTGRIAYILNPLLVRIDVGRLAFHKNPLVNRILTGLPFPNHLHMCYDTRMCLTPFGIKNPLQAARNYNGDEDVRQGDAFTDQMLLFLENGLEGTQQG